MTTSQLEPCENMFRNATPSRHPFELRLLAPFLLMAAFMAAFLKIASEVFEGEAHAIDLWIQEACRVPGQPGTPIGPVWFQVGVRDLTALGWFILLVVCGVTMLVGASRVRLGVHWASDVAAGWAMGAAWALGCWLLARWLHM